MNEIPPKAEYYYQGALFSEGAFRVSVSPRRALYIVQRLSDGDGFYLDVGASAPDRESLLAVLSGLDGPSDGERASMIEQAHYLPIAPQDAPHYTDFWYRHAEWYAEKYLY